MATWDIARVPFPCAACHETVGQGEAFRVSKIRGRIGHCEACSIALFGEPAPAVITPRSFTEQLRDAAAQMPPKADEKRPTIRQGSQPSADPRGQGFRYQRHGIARAVRESIDRDKDWRLRASGDTK